MDGSAGTVRLEVLLPHDIFNPFLRQYKGMLETLARFDTVGKLRNLRLTVLEISDALKGRQVLARAAVFIKDVRALQPLTTLSGRSAGQFAR